MSPDLLGVSMPLQTERHELHMSLRFLPQIQRADKAGELILVLLLVAPEVLAVSCVIPAMQRCPHTPFTLHIGHRTAAGTKHDSTIACEISIQ